MNDKSRPRTVSSRDLVSAAFSLRWSSETAEHEDVFHFPKLNVWRDLDLLPQTVQQEILGQPAGHTGSAGFPPGVLVEPRDSRNLVRIRARQFNRRWLKHRSIEPRLGRFYPRGVLQGVAGIYPEDHGPARLIGMAGDQLEFDLNHPLSRYPAEVAVEIREILPGGDEHGGRCTDILSDLAKGPGMQVRQGDQVTDFFADAPFRRMDPGNDTLFYALPRMMSHLDATALERVSRLYGELVTPGAEVLDLMSSFDSHLPDGLATSGVTGLGMNRDELDANPVLGGKLVQDLNENSHLPFPENSFDAVLCTVSVEYLVQPFAVFREVARVLRPGGVFALTFSNRWFPPKVIDLWQNLHEFERPALVLEYFLQSRDFERLHSFSERGLLRPEDDRYAAQSYFSDPIHAVWGYKKGN